MLAHPVQTQVLSIAADGRSFPPRDVPILVTPRRHADSRGHLSETWSRRAFAAVGIDVDFVQDNESLSRAAGTLRGLHFQGPPAAQAKLVRVVRGAIRDVAVDIRRGSPSFGAWVAAELGAEDGRQLFVPAGFLHGFVTLVPDTIVAYKCSAPYAPDREGAIRFDDPDLAIDWGIGAADAILSPRDAAAPRLRDLVSPFVWNGGG